MAIRSGTQRRRDAILGLLKTGSWSIPRLAAELETSESTIRRDLREMAADGEIIRTIGGAAAAGYVEPPLGERMEQQAEAKDAIAACGSRTARRRGCAHRLPRRRLDDRAPGRADQGPQRAHRLHPRPRDRVGPGSSRRAQGDHGRRRGLDPVARHHRCAVRPCAVAHPRRHRVPRRRCRRSRRRDSANRVSTRPARRSSSPSEPERSSSSPTVRSPAARSPHGRRCPTGWTWIDEHGEHAHEAEPRRGGTRGVRPRYCKMVRITRTRSLLLIEASDKFGHCFRFSVNHASDNDNFTVPCEADLPCKFRILKVFLLVRYAGDEYFSNDTPMI
jgi:hypothetical protein